MSTSHRENIISALAEAISSCDISRIAQVLDGCGEFVIQDENSEIVKSGRDRFIAWIEESYNKYYSGRKRGRNLEFTIVKCIQCLSGNPVIIFEDGKFPVFRRIQKAKEKSGLVVKMNDSGITGIEFCIMALKTENPFIYERRCIRPGL